MALKPERLEAIMAYCRLSADELTPAETALFAAMAEASVAYLEGAGIRPPLGPGVEATEELTHKQAMYDLVVNALTLDAWDKRDATADKEQHDNPSLRRMMTQLKLAGGGLV